MIDQNIYVKIVFYKRTIAAGMDKTIFPGFRISICKNLTSGIIFLYIWVINS